MNSPRVILMPGMGVDERLFEPQRAAGLDFEVPRMPMPDPADDLPAYAARVRDSIRLTRPCILGGVSFGGMVACELAALTDCRAVILVASCRSRAALPRASWHLEWASRLVPDTVIHHRSELSVRLFARWEQLNPDQSACSKPCPGTCRCGTSGWSHA